MVGAFIPSVPGRPPARRSCRPSPGARGAARQPVLPRPRQPRLRQGRGGRDADRRLRARTRPRAGRTASPGTTAASPVESDMDRFAPLLEGAIRRFPFLERAGRHPPALPPGRDDPGRAIRCSGRCPGVPRVLGRGRPVAQRLRRRRRDRAGRSRTGSPTASRESTSTPTGRGGSARRTATRGSRPAARARDVPLLLPAALPVRRRRVAGRGRRLEPAPRPPRRSSAPCSARRTAGSAPTTSSPASRWRRSGADQRRSAGREPPWFDRVAAEEHRAVPRAGRDHRPDLVRQDRGARARGAGAARARLRQPTSTGRSAASSTRSSATRAAGSSPTSR